MKLRTLTACVFAWGLLGGCGGSEPSPTPAEEAAAPAAEKAATIDPATAATVKGTIQFEGTPEEGVRLRMGADPKCEEAHNTPVYFKEIEVNDNGTLKNVFVWVKRGLESYSFDPPAEAAVLDQHGCVYVPHVLGVQTRQTIRILNSDQTTHNVHPVPQINREWNESQRPGQDKEKSFPRQEVMIPVKCNVHPWMKAYIGVVAHPFFAVTGEDGSFELKGLPPGEYVIEAWHEKLPPQEMTVTVGPSETKEVSFTFKG